jgi:hypothetical protein
MEMLLSLTPLDLLIIPETRKALYRLHALVQPTDSKGRINGCTSSRLGIGVVVEVFSWCRGEVGGFP